MIFSETRCPLFGIMLLELGRSADQPRHEMAG